MWSVNIICKNIHKKSEGPYSTFNVSIRAICKDQCAWVHRSYAVFGSLKQIYILFFVTVPAWKTKLKIIIIMYLYKLNNLYICYYNNYIVLWSRYMEIKIIIMLILQNVKLQ